MFHLKRTLKPINFLAKHWNITCTAKLVNKKQLAFSVRARQGLSAPWGTETQGWQRIPGLAGQWPHQPGPSPMKTVQHEQDRHTDWPGSTEHPNHQSRSQRWEQDRTMALLRQGLRVLSWPDLGLLAPWSELGGGSRWVSQGQYGLFMPSRPWHQITQHEKSLSCHFTVKIKENPKS